MPEPEPMCALARRVTDIMRVNYDYRSRSGIEERLRYCISSQTCTFNQEQRSWLESIGINRRVYSPITSTKNRAVYSMLVELMQYGSEIPFEFFPTPDPELGEEVETQIMAEKTAEINSLIAQIETNGAEISQDTAAALASFFANAASVSYDSATNAKNQIARNRAKRLQAKVWDLMVHGGYRDAFFKCLDDFCVYGTCVMVGPVMRNVVRNKIVTDRKSGVRKVKRVIESVPVFESVSPMDCYPAPDAVDITDGALCVRVSYTKEELWRFQRSSADGGKKRGEEGWRDSAVAKLLASRKNGVKLSEFPSDPSLVFAIDRNGDESNSCKYEGIRCFSYIEGHDLLEIGITRSQDGTRIDNDGFYYTETIVIDGAVLFCRIYDERIGSPLSKSVFYKKPGSWWGESIADKLFSVQTTMNNAIIALLRNMGPASSAMMWIKDVSRLVDKSDSGLAAEPGKIYGFGSAYAGQPQGDSGVPMGVLQIPSNASELLRVADWATKQSDLDSGIPAFSEGTGGSNGGALRTAEGLRTYTEHSSRGVKSCARHLDSGVVCRPAEMMANWVLVYDDDMSLKGDVEIQSVGFMGKINRAQYDQARVQFFNLCLNSQFMQSIFGVKGMVELCRPSLKDLGINEDNVCPSPERIEMLEKLEQLKQMLLAVGAGAQQGNAAQPQQGQPDQGAGMNQGVTPIPSVGGGVAGRRAAA